MGHDLSAVVVAQRLAELRALCRLTDYLHRARVPTGNRARDADGASSTRTIRPVELRDLEAVRGVLVETWHATYDAVLGVERVTEITDDWHAIDELRTQIDRPAHAFLVALVGDAIVGTGSASRKGGEVVVQRLYVKPAYQKAGHGVALLDALIARLGPASAVELEVAVTNAQAIHFYEARGFAVAARRGDDFVMRRERG